MDQIINVWFIGFCLSYFLLICGAPLHVSFSGLWYRLCLAFRVTVASIIWPITWVIIYFREDFKCVYWD